MTRAHYIFFALSLLLLTITAPYAHSTEYWGRIIDESGRPVSFATVYLLDEPSVGTATNNDGSFVVWTFRPDTSKLIVSFVGYEKLELRLSDLSREDTTAIVLREQPIALEEMVVAAKPQKQKNKRKQMAQLLYKVYNRMLYDFPDEPVKYHVVSDVRMLSEQQPWGMEQMIANVVCLPGGSASGRDSVQFAGELCKRFFDSRIRTRANEIYADDELPDKMRDAAYAVDSGVVVHQALWAIGDVRYDFEQTMNDLRHWSVSQESEHETVLTHTESHNYFGIFKYVVRRNYIVDSETYSVLRFTEDGSAQVSIPFGYKLKGIYLDMLNILNMDNESIERFRLRRANSTVRLNTIYHRVDGKLCILEKNMIADATLTSTKKVDIPINVKATQRATTTQSRGVQPLSSSQLTRRVERQNVSIY